MLKISLRLTVVLAVLSGIVNVMGGKLRLNDDCIRISDNDHWLVDVATGQVVKTTQPYHWSETQPHGEAVLRLFNEDVRVRHGAPLMLKNGHREKVVENNVWLGAWSNSGKYIFYVRGDRTVGLANSEGEILQQADLPVNSFLLSASFAADDAYVAVLGYDGAAHLFVYAVPDLKRVEIEGSNNVALNRWSPTGHLFAGAFDYNLYVISPETGIVVDRGRDLQTVGLRANWSPDGEDIVISGRRITGITDQHEFTLDFVNPDGELVRDIITPRMIYLETSEEDKTEFFIWAEDNTLLAWRGTPETGYELVRYRPDDESIEVITSGFVRPIEFLADGRWAAAWREGYDLMLIEVATGRQVPLLTNLPQSPLDYVDYPRLTWSSNQELLIAVFDNQFGWVNLTTGVGGQVTAGLYPSFESWLDDKALIYAAHLEANTRQIIKVDVNTGTQTILRDNLIGADVYGVDQDTIVTYWRQSDGVAGFDVWESSKAEPRRLTYPPTSSTLPTAAYSVYRWTLSPDKKMMIVNDPGITNRNFYWLMLDGTQPPKFVLEDSMSLSGWKADSSAFAMISRQEPPSLNVFNRSGALKRVIELSDVKLGGYTDLNWESCV